MFFLFYFVLFFCLLSVRILVPNSSMCADFPPTDQFSDPSWVSYHQTQFWPYLPRDRVRSHRLRAWSHKPDLHFRCQSAVQVITCVSDWLFLRGSQDPNLDLSTWLELLTEFRKPSCSLDYQFTKGSTGYESTAR